MPELNPFPRGRDFAEGKREDPITMHIGCHLSVAGGYRQLCADALQIGADTFQFFTRNPRGGSGRVPSDTELAELGAFLREHDFAPAVAHAPYTLNPCAAAENTLRFAREVMRSDLELLDRFPVERVYYNFHPGSHVGQGIERGIELIAETLDLVMDRDLKPVVLLETMSGKGSEVGSRFEELAEIISRSRYGDLLGVCLDTCHVFCAGYDIVNAPEAVLEEFDRVVGLDRLKAIHLNDSMMPFASHKDRHAKLDEGEIGFEALARFVSLAPVRDLPLELETPNELDGYGAEIARMRASASR